MLQFDTSRLPPSSPHLTSLATVLLVNEVVDAANYYRDKLGFAYNKFVGDPPSFVLLHRDTCHVMLKQAMISEHVVPNRQNSDQLWNMYFWVTDVAALYRELTRRGALIEYDLVDQPYGVREFAVLDLDGYSIGFGQEMTAPAMTAE
jgi:uncharacterized glyoxalase superfamily protein PhnB